MSFSLVYLIRQFFYRIWAFLEDWYIGSFLAISRKGAETLESLDRSWALKITVKNLFKPLYQDETLVGRILGFIFRFGRVVFASVLYACVIAIFLFAYLIWALAPIYIIFGRRL